MPSIPAAKKLYATKAAAEKKVITVQKAIHSSM